MRAADVDWVWVERFLERDDRCLAPLGCTEQHAGLSLATDTLLAEKLANDVAERVDGLAFPALAYGLTPSFAAYPGSVTFSYETYGRVLRDLLDSLRRQGFRRILLVNGHGGNTPARAAVMEWLRDVDVRVIWHDWWNAPKTWSVVQAIDPQASHASWMENFPWTRVSTANGDLPAKPMVDLARLRTLDPARVREVLGDGSYGGRYARSDEEMARIWSAAIDETVELYRKGW